jgi:TatA/E family protein of Tat protein translocase
MGSLGIQEIIFIFILALLIFGPKRLPELGRTVGKGLAEFRKASNDLKRTINAELALEEESTKPPITLTRRVPAGTIAAPLVAAVTALEESAPAASEPIELSSAASSEPVSDPSEGPSAAVPPSTGS